MSDVHREDPIQGPVVHEYDGIEEADNQLPRWWLGGFYATILFSVFYWFVYHEFKIADLPMQAHAQALAAQSGGKVSEELLAAVASDPDAIQRGQSLFQTHCQVCHLEDGRGKIGPNLTDPFWKHGGAPLDIYTVISGGVPDKGMPPWKAVLGQAAVQDLTAFVLDIRDDNLSGKSPEGERWVPGR